MTAIYVVVEKPADYEQVPYGVDYDRPDDGDVTIVFVSNAMPISLEVAEKVDLRRGYVVEIHAKRLNHDDGFSGITHVRGWWEQEAEKKKKKTKKRKTLNK